MLRIATRMMRQPPAVHRSALVKNLLKRPNMPGAEPRRHGQFIATRRARPGKAAAPGPGTPGFGRPPSDRAWRADLCVGALVSAATGHTLADYMSSKIWSRFGMECDLIHPR